MSSASDEHQNSAELELQTNNYEFVLFKKITLIEISIKKKVS
jgi:hypothetical protein